MIESKIVALTAKDGTRTVFRSILEARWSRYFDAMGMAWQYEPFKFQLNEKGLTYTPDFQVEGIGIIEIKPTFTELANSADRIEQFSGKTGERVYLFAGRDPMGASVMALTGNPLMGLAMDYMQRAIVLGGKQRRGFAREHYDLFYDSVIRELKHASDHRLDSDPVNAQEIMKLTGAVDYSDSSENRGTTILRRLMKKAATNLRQHAA